MIAINAIELISGAMMRMNDRPLLNVPAREIIVELFISSSFISIIPENNRRMIHIPQYHLFYQRFASSGAIKFLPAS